MNVIVCVDNSFGMLFNNRRVSRDKILVEKVKELTKESDLWINEFSKSLFDSEVIIDNDMLDKALLGNYCFVENLHLASYLDRIEKIYLLKWNRDYPSDFYFDINLENDFKICNTDEFVGNSHDKITMEEWERK